jgi:2-dehydro-3-deoxyphosphogluconate aldolase/(4S)-4-hydroxy-2-oxoglutarate aldolase
MSHEQLLREVLDRGLVAILRTASNAGLADAARAIYEAGIRTFEVTLTIPDALGLIRKLRSEMPSDTIIGAGTVLDDSTARLAITAGADFLVSPTFDANVVRTARRYGKLSIPGAFTPTEILAAWEAGADLVKVFPAEVLGPKFFEAVRRPLPQVRMIPTGAIDPEMAAGFLKAGACGVGVGGGLSDGAAIAARRFDGIRSLAAQYVDLVRRHRQENG